MWSSHINVNYYGGHERNGESDLQAIQEKRSHQKYSLRQKIRNQNPGGRNATKILFQGKS